MDDTEDPSGKAPERDGWDAHLDPWCVAALTSGEHVLYGYTVWHPNTGGLSWLASTELLELDPVAGTARTRSGRRYRLGRRFDVMDVGCEGEEARLAVEHVLGDALETLPRLRSMERYWVTTRKMARHLQVPPPPRRLEDVRTFIDLHQDAYVALRDRLKRP